jgi:hypothetical protein
MNAADYLKVDGDLAKKLAFMYRHYDGVVYNEDKISTAARADLPAWMRAGFLSRAASYAAVAGESDLSSWYSTAAEAATQAAEEQKQENPNVPTWLLPAIELHLLAGSRLQTFVLCDQLAAFSRERLRPEMIRVLATAVALTGARSDRPNVSAQRYLPREWEEVESVRLLEIQLVGRLRLPLKLYLDASSIVTMPATDRARRASDLLNRAAELIDARVASAQLNLKHWLNFDSAMLPIEPEGLSLVLALFEVLKESHTGPRDFIERLDTPTRAYLEVARVLSSENEGR